MSVVFQGSSASRLAEVVTAGGAVLNGDVGWVWINDYPRKMVFNSSSTRATDLVNHPYYQRPNDFAGTGVWEEDVGAEQSPAWNMDQIRMGELIIFDDGSIHSEFKTTYDDVDPGFWFGWNSTAHKFNMGDESNSDPSLNSFIKWTGAGFVIQLADGETFDLYGGLEVYGDINVYQDGDIKLWGSLADADAGELIFKNEYSTGNYWDVHMRPSYTSGKGMFIYPGSDADGLLNIGIAYSNRFSSINLSAADYIYTHAYYDSNNYAILNLSSYISVPINNRAAQAELSIKCNGTSSGISIDSLNTLGTVTGHISFTVLGTATWSLYKDYLQIHPNTYWIGLGSSAGRMNFNNQATDYVTFHDCYVGIGQATPTVEFEVNGDALIDNGDSSFAFDNTLLFDYYNSMTVARRSTTQFLFNSAGMDVLSGTLFIESGQVGVNDTSPSYDLDVTGDINFTGELTGGTKTFKIDHPLTPKEKILYHATVEAPRHDLIYRGIAKFENGFVEIDIDLVSNMSPGTFGALTQNAVVTALQNQNSHDRPVSTKIENGKFTIISENFESADYVSWVVMAERADALVRHSKLNDAQGHLIPEIDKKEPTEDQLKDLDPIIETTDLSNEIGVYSRRVDSLSESKGYYLNPEAFGTERPTRKITKILASKKEEKRKGV